MITVIDKSGRKSTVSRDWTGYWIGLGAIGNRDLVHCHAPRPIMRRTCMPSRSRESSERCIARRIGSCCTTSPRTAGCCCLETPFESAWRVRPPGDARERDLTWLLASVGHGTLTRRRDRDFRGSVASPRPLATQRSFAEAWMVLRRSRLERAAAERCLQTGDGCSRCLERIWSSCRPGLVRWSRSRRETWCGSETAAWLGDSKRIVFTGDPGDSKPRGYIQEIPAGIPRAITPDGVVLAGKAAVRDDNSILGRVGATWMLFPIHGGDGQPVPALTPGDIPLQWSHDGRYVYTVDNVEGARPPAVDVFRVELATGDRRSLEDAHAVRPRGRRRHERNRGDHPGRTVVLLLLHATARRPVRGRRAQVTICHASDRLPPR